VSDTLRRPEEFIEAGLIAPARTGDLAAVADRYAVAVTRDVAALIDPSDAADPIARQFLPDPRELVIAPEERADPIGDHAHEPVKGIVHRYPDRVLLKPIHVCPVYCRFCFRREEVGPGSEALSPVELVAALAYIRSHDAIWEVILSGGDPLMLSARRLQSIIEALAAIPHVAVIRIHTRVPVVDPKRVTPALVAALRSDKAVYVVLHANHARELTPAVKAAARRLSRAGIPLLSQSVLLKGVNDEAAALEALFRGLVAMRVKPYYLHHPDLAQGTAHLRVSLGQGRELMRTLRGRVSGLCQPSYVLDLPGGHGKVPVGPCYARETSEPGEWQVEDPQGDRHLYPPKKFLPA
jgi:lysine 2,3-aminomutase